MYVVIFCVIVGFLTSVSNIPNISDDIKFTVGSLWVMVGAICYTILQLKSERK